WTSVQNFAWDSPASRFQVHELVKCALDTSMWYPRSQRSSRWSCSAYRVPERDVIQMFPVLSTSGMAIRPSTTLRHRTTGVHEKHRPGLRLPRYHVSTGCRPLPSSAREVRPSAPQDSQILYLDTSSPEFLRPVGDAPGPRVDPAFEFHHAAVADALPIICILDFQQQPEIGGCWFLLESCRICGD